MAQVNRMENPDDEDFCMTRAEIWDEEQRAEGRSRIRYGSSGDVACSSSPRAPVARMRPRVSSHTWRRFSM